MYRGEWGTLIQLIVSRGLYDYRGVQYVDHSFGVAKFAGLNMGADGTLRRWTFDGPAGDGYSDHFPVYARFITVADNAPNRWLTLSHPADDAAPANGPRVAYAAMDLGKTALTAAQIPAGANLRDGSFNGKLFHVEGRAIAGSRLAVTFQGGDYEVYAPDPALREQLRAVWHDGATVHFYGELGQYRGHWQFVVKDASWVK